MIESILTKLKCKQLIRLDVDMKFLKKSLDTFIGRAAHIALISDPSVIDMISFRYGELL
jgi:hypothetical protein